MHRGGSGRSRLIGASGVSQFGNWLTFTGLLQYLQAAHGPVAVTTSFLVQSLSALLLARPLSDAVAPRHTRSAWLVAQVLLAALSLALLARGAGPIYVYAVLAVTAVLRLAASTLFLALVTRWSPPEQRAATFTALGSVAATTLALGPATGGVIAASLGTSALFVIDAATFLAAAALLPRAPVDPRPEGALPSPPADVRAARTYRIGLPDGLSWRADPVLLVWITLALAGAGVNVVEVPVLTEVHAFGVRAFGIALSCYGLGGLAAFVLVTMRPRLGGRVTLGAAGYAVALAVWVYGGTAGAYLGFAAAGLTAGVLSGQVRAGIGALARPPCRPEQVWAWANEAVMLVNLGAYLVGVLAFRAGAGVRAMAGVAVALAAGHVVATARWSVSRRDGTGGRSRGRRR